MEVNIKNITPKNNYVLSIVYTYETYVLDSMQQCTKEAFLLRTQNIFLNREFLKKFTSMLYYLDPLCLKFNLN